MINGGGQVTSVTDALSHQWQFGYTGGDLTSVTNPLSQVQTRFVDAVGQVLVTTHPLGRVTQLTTDKLNRVTAVLDPRGGQTAFAYDPNGNLESLTDALTQHDLHVRRQRRRRSAHGVDAAER